VFYVGIDVAKDEHYCVIVNEEKKLVCPGFSFPNSAAGFSTLVEKIAAIEPDPTKIKVGLEATGHYSHNLLGFLLEKRFPAILLNPLQTKLYRNSLSLRKAKTDKIDAEVIADLLKDHKYLKTYSETSYHITELKSLTRFRFKLVAERGRLKADVKRFLVILFPELEKLVYDIHSASIYAMLKEMPGTDMIARCNLKHLTSLLSKASRGAISADKAAAIREAARTSIGRQSSTIAFQLTLTLQQIELYNKQIEEVEKNIQTYMETVKPPLLSIPGLGFQMAAVLLAEIGDFLRFDSPSRIMAFAGLCPSTNDSGKVEDNHGHLEKRGSCYLRYALLHAARCVSQWDETFKKYMAKKQAEGKHYCVALVHVAKKLTRVVYALMKTGKQYIPEA
jgi:transposase